MTLIVNDDRTDEVVNGIKIVSTGFKPKNRVERFVNSRRLLFEKAFAVDAEIYQMHDPDLLPLGNKLKKAGKKIIFDSHEDIPRQIMDKQWIPGVLRGTVSKVYEKYEKNSIRKYDGVVSPTPYVVSRLREVNNNSILVTNYPIANTNEEIIRSPEKAICFAGGVAEIYCHEAILQAIEHIDGIRYILAGPGKDTYINKLKSMPAWGKVDYKGVIPFSEVKSIYSKAIAGMAVNYSTQDKERGTLGVLKLFEFMESKLPVICSNYPLWEEIINKYKCGVCVEPNNVKEIKKAIEHIIDNPEEAVKMGERGRQAVFEQYNWGTQEKELLELYDRLSGERG